MKRLLCWLLVPLVTSPVFSQCALCREALEASSGGPGKGNLALGFNWAILALLGAVFVVGGALVGFFAYAARAADRAQSPPEQASTPGGV